MHSVRKRLRQLATAIQVLVLATSVSLPFVGQQAFADSTVPLTGTVTGPGGEILGTNTHVSVTAPGGSQDLYTTYVQGLTTVANNGIGYDANGVPYAADVVNTVGQYELDVAPGTYDVHVSAPSSASWSTTVIPNVTISGPTSLDLQMNAAVPVHTLSGTFTDVNGNPLPNIWIMAAGVGPQVYTQTDANGAYHFSLPAYQYGYNLTAYNTESMGSGFPQGMEYRDYDLLYMNSDTTEDLHIPYGTTTLHVTVKDKAGNPGANQVVKLQEQYAPGPNGGSNPAILYATNLTTSDNQGLAAMQVWDAPGIGLGAVSAVSAQDDVVVANQSDIDLTQTTSVELDEINGLLVDVRTPTNLTATMSNGSPVLNWEGYGGESYAIFRDGEQIDSINTTLYVDPPAPTTYTDTTALPGVHTYYVEAFAHHMGNSDPSNTVTIGTAPDTTPPTIGYTASPAPNAAGWNNGTVTVNFTCADDTAVATCSDPVTLSGEGAGQTATGTATDTAGNTASVTTAPINIDRTAPTITASASPAANSFGWNNSNVTVTFTCADALSGIASCPSPVTVSTEAANQQVTGTAVDKAGNQKSATVTVNLDKTAPTATNAAMTNTFILFQANETFTADASDALSGVAGGEYYFDTDPGQGHGLAMAYTGGHLTASATISASSGLSIGNHTLYIRSKDKAGNWSTVASRTFTYL